MSINSEASIVIYASMEQRWDDIFAAVDLIQESDSQPKEIILVVDHNAALYDRFVQHYQENELVRVIQNRYTQGLLRARNNGITAARGQYIGFLDDDAIADAGWLSALTSWCKDPSVMGTGGWINPIWVGNKPLWFPTEFYWVFGCSYTGMPGELAPIRNLLGASMVFPRQTVETVGGFRTGIGRVGDTPLGCEKTDLCIRARQAHPDKKFIFDPDATTTHHVPAKRITWVYLMARCYNKGLSKALLSKLVGASSGLATERDYALKTLPKGVVKGIADALFRLDLSGLGRAFAIVAGLAFTGAGFLVGQVTLFRHTTQQEVVADSVVG
jgi:GT2 family glycosyltransferase